MRLHAAAELPRLLPLLLLFCFCRTAMPWLMLCWRGCSSKSCINNHKNTHIRPQKSRCSLVGSTLRRINCPKCESFAVPAAGCMTDHMCAPSWLLLSLFLTGTCCAGLCRCLEVGCGSGYVICSAVLALQHTHSSSTCTAGSTAAQADGGTGLTTQGTGAAASCSFIATDINTAALEATAATLKAHGVRPAAAVLL